MEFSFHIFKLSAENYNLFLQRTRMHEFVHVYMKRPEFVDLMQRFCVLGDGNQDQGITLCAYVISISIEPY
ncbi:mRNA cap guanine-N7 methyltransferase, putative [Medicago truncatula]|uniref:mRNA cap guanine-N7 methyltransferase, putative n=1 Tax=Medicago truncatula TaxID=3880 RepID=G7IYR3_MEDTR|nr:mRNA cap guanine-N7 methyltransferase, putative [Medicago truncatula]